MFSRKPFDGFGIKKEGQLIVDDFGGYQTRNESTLKLIRESIAAYGVGDFGWIYVNTGDRPVTKKRKGRPVLSYCTDQQRYDLCCPDFVFDHWSQTGLMDYEATRLKLLDLDQPAKENKIGWRGADTHLSRRNLVSKFRSGPFDFELIQWDRSNPNHLTASNFMTLEDQIGQWRFLLDVEGNGYSGRLKLLLAANRVLFVQERPYEEYFFGELKPWVHYVPVKRDFSDIAEKVQHVLDHPELESKMIEGARNFSQRSLSREAALKKWAEILSEAR